MYTKQSFKIHKKVKNIIINLKDTKVTDREGQAIKIVQADG